jgi:hypothetical protein
VKRPTLHVSLFVLLAMLAVTPACRQDPWAKKVEARSRLMAKAKSLADSHASMEHCREVLGDPAFVFNVENYVLWKYNLAKPGSAGDDLLTLVFESGSSNLKRVYVQPVDYFGKKRVTPVSSGTPMQASPNDANK